MDSRQYQAVPEGDLSRALLMKVIFLHFQCGRPIEKNQGCNHMRCSESGGGGRGDCCHRLAGALMIGEFGAVLLYLVMLRRWYERKPETADIRVL